MQGITQVNIRLIFLHIGDIDTLAEKYQAHVVVESRWLVDVGQILGELSEQDQIRVNDGKSVSLVDFPERHWHPQIYIDNAVGDLKETVLYSIRRSKKDNLFYICERRNAKGYFWETLELQYFPTDIQELSVTVASMFYNDKVILVADPNHLSAVNRESFSRQQEWLLYERITAKQRYIPEFLRDHLDEDDENQNLTNLEHRKQSVLTISCCAARRAKYFIWHGYVLILFIMIASLCIFGIPANLVANRLQTISTLLLTSITLRWTMSRSVPSVAYLTSLDKYAFICIASMVLQCVWFAIIGTAVFINTPDFELRPGMTLTKLDEIAFFIILGVFIVLHVGLIIWLYAVPLRLRRQLSQSEKKKNIE